MNVLQGGHISPQPQFSDYRIDSFCVERTENCRNTAHPYKEQTGYRPGHKIKHVQNRRKTGSSTKETNSSWDINTIQGPDVGKCWKPELNNIICDNTNAVKQDIRSSHHEDNTCGVTDSGYTAGQQLDNENSQAKD